MEGETGDFSIAEVIRKLKKSIKGFPVPSVKVIAGKKDPFAVLISCLISLRTSTFVALFAVQRGKRIKANKNRDVRLGFNCRLQ